MNHRHRSDLHSHKRSKSSQKGRSLVTLQGARRISNNFLSLKAKSWPWGIRPAWPAELVPQSEVDFPRSQLVGTGEQNYFLTLRLPPSLSLPLPQPSPTPSFLYALLFPFLSPPLKLSSSPLTAARSRPSPSLHFPLSWSELKASSNHVMRLARAAGQGWELRSIDPLLALRSRAVMPPSDRRHESETSFQGGKEEERGRKKEEEEEGKKEGRGEAFEQRSCWRSGGWTKRWIEGEEADFSPKSPLRFSSELRGKWQGSFVS